MSELDGGASKSIGFPTDHLASSGLVFNCRNLPATTVPLQNHSQIHESWSSVLHLMLCLFCVLYTLYYFALRPLGCQANAVRKLPSGVHLSFAATAGYVVNKSKRDESFEPVNKSPLTTRSPFPCNLLADA